MAAMDYSYLSDPSAWYFKSDHEPSLLAKLFNSKPPMGRIERAIYDEVRRLRE